MSNTEEKTVRYNHQKWVVDTENDTLCLQTERKVKVSIDEVWMELSDRDQNTIADLQAAKNETVDVTDFDYEDID